VLHELCFEDCSSHRHPRYDNESDGSKPTFRIVPERRRLRVQRRVVIRFYRDNHVNSLFARKEKVYCTAK